VETKHHWCLRWEGVDELNVVSSRKLVWIWGSETWSHCKLHLVEDFRHDELLEVGVVGSSIPVICNVTTIHDLTIEISQIGVWNLLEASQIVVENITTDSQVTIIEAVLPGPSLGTKLPSTQDKGMEHAKSEQKCLELWLLVGFGLVVEGLVELTQGLSDVGLEIGRSLVGDLQGILQN